MAPQADKSAVRAINRRLPGRESPAGRESGRLKIDREMDEPIGLVVLWSSMPAETRSVFSHRCKK